MLLMEREKRILAPCKECDGFFFPLGGYLLTGCLLRRIITNLKLNNLQAGGYKRFIEANPKYILKGKSDLQLSLHSHYFIRMRI